MNLLLMLRFTFLLKRLEELSISFSDKVKTAGLSIPLNEFLQLTHMLVELFIKGSVFSILSSNDLDEEVLNAVATLILIVLSVDLESPIHSLIIVVSSINLIKRQLLNSLL
jgi:hypothetical protein